MSNEVFAAGDNVTLTDAPPYGGHFPHNVEMGDRFVVNYIDGCCLNVTGEDGMSHTLHQGRFAKVKEDMDE